VHVGQLIDRIGPANRFIVFFAQPGKLLFEQLQYVVNKCLLMAISVFHAVLLRGLEDQEASQLRWTFGIKRKEVHDSCAFLLREA